MLGIVVALPVESRTLTRQSGHVGQTLRLGPDIRLRIAGMGPESSISAAGSLQRQGAGAILNWGCAAALSPDLTPGQLLLPRTYVLPDRSEVHGDTVWWRRLRDSLTALSPVTAPLAGTETVLSSPAAKHSLHRKTRAPAADMESAFLAGWCLEHGLPFATVRAVADDADTAVPAAVLDAGGRNGDIDLFKLLVRLLRHPGQIGALLRLGRQFHLARVTLARAADRLLPGKFCLI